MHFQDFAAGDGLKKTFLRTPFGRRLAHDTSGCEVRFLIAIPN